MFAVIMSGGKQHRVTEGERLRLERLDAELGDEVVFDRVLMVGGEDGVQVGQPLVDGSRVTAEVVAQGRGRKIRVIKFKRRKGYMRRQGHRQAYTEVRVTGIKAASAA
ncbi:MAG: 50S ribosomal protein L21 [Gammaproteobacteria bacterium]|nr:50S ribosomal protein L21 [Gammaproteobacteria bacterium]MCY4343182.1 50S ribosomal protein L21 [Gammaproteobacteria bacterium]